MNVQTMVNVLCDEWNRKRFYFTPTSLLLMGENNFFLLHLFLIWMLQPTVLVMWGPLALLATSQVLVQVAMLALRLLQGLALAL